MKRLLFSLLALIVSQTLLAQKYVVTGSVEDERNMNKLEFASATLFESRPHGNAHGEQRFH